VAALVERVGFRQRIGDEAVARRHSTCHERAARRGAEGHRRVEVSEHGAAFGEGVKVRRLEPGMPVAAEVAPAEGVGEDDDDVDRLALLGGVDSRRQCRERESGAREAEEMAEHGATPCWMPDGSIAERRRDGEHPWGKLDQGNWSVPFGGGGGRLKMGRFLRMNSRPRRMGTGAPGGSAVGNLASIGYGPRWAAETMSVTQTSMKPTSQ